MVKYRTTDFRIPIRKSPTQVYQSARLSVHLSQSPLNKNRHRNLPAIRVNLCACFTCSGRSVSNVREYDGWPLREQVRCPEGRCPFGSGFPIGASSIPVGTRLSLGKSSVLYLCFRLTPKRGWLYHLLCGQIAFD